MTPTLPYPSQHSLGKKRRKAKAKQIKIKRKSESEKRKAKSKEKRENTYISIFLPVPPKNFPLYAFSREWGNTIKTAKGGEDKLNVFKRCRQYAEKKGRLAGYPLDSNENL